MPRVVLFDVDSRIPNLALMKYSAWYKARQWEVALCRAPARIAADRYVASTVFFRTSSQKKLNTLKALYGDRIEIGGSGIDLRQRLRADIDDCFPDYSLYGHDRYALPDPRL
jgi:hypothetical protein